MRQVWLCVALSAAVAWADAGGVVVDPAGRPVTGATVLVSGPVQLTLRPAVPADVPPGEHFSVGAADGKPLANVSVEVRDASGAYRDAQTNVQGEFHVNGLVKGLAQVACWREEMLVETAAEAGRGDLVLRFNRRAR